MYVSDCISVNERGHLTIGSYDTVELAKQFGTPLYAFDENEIRRNIREFKKSIDDEYNGNGLVVYASKAFCCKEMLRLCNSEGAGVDVVSGGELYTAISVDFPAENIVFHGNNKTYEELEMAVDYNVGRIVVDNLTELRTLDKIAEEKGKTVGIMLRIKPGIDAHTHSFIKTGQIDSKFGFSLETGEALEGIKEALSMENIKLRGLHCHIGSQIFDLDPFELAATVMLDLFKQVKDETGVELEDLNLGGGFGIKYLKSDRPRAYSDYMRKVSTAVNSYAADLGLKTPFILIEPGRSIVGAAGLTLYTVGCVKDIPDVRTYISVDGGMGDNPRYALYQSAYEVICANKASEKRDWTVTVAGKCCESGDLIQEWTRVQPVEPGDILAVLSTGAYNYSMASNYNRIPKLPVIFVKNGKAREVVKRETYEQMCSCDI
ncbi:MAG: diaminopimelate decarboxylase [Clostridia bacterium]|nr:diaminopimelate decarboxylase [Clostridia bacterium]